MIQAYDSHCNLVLGDVEEIVYVVEEDDEDENVKTVKKQSEMLFVRGIYALKWFVGFVLEADVVVRRFGCFDIAAAIAEALEDVRCAVPGTPCIQWDANA